MNTLIKFEGNTPVLDYEVQEKIAAFEKAAKNIKQAEDELKAAILAEMEAKGIAKIDSDVLAISYVAPTDRETLNSKQLRADLPDIYDEYIEIKPVKSSIRIKVK